MDRPFDFAEVVRASHRKAEAIVFADTQPGRMMQGAYLEAIGAHRNVSPLGPDGLTKHAPRPSWAMAAIVAPGLDLAPLAAWARKVGRDAEDRIRFYLLPRTPIARAFTPWYAAGFDDPRTSDARDWRALHPSFGLFFANTVYLDAKAHQEWFESA